MKFNNLQYENGALSFIPLDPCFIKKGRVIKNATPYKWDVGKKFGEILLALTTEEKRCFLSRELLYFLFGDIENVMKSGCCNIQDVSYKKSPMGKSFIKNGRKATTRYSLKDSSASGFLFWELRQNVAQDIVIL